MAVYRSTRQSLASLYDSDDSEDDEKEEEYVPLLLRFLLLGNSALFQTTAAPGASGLKMLPKVSGVTVGWSDQSEPSIVTG